MKVIVIGGLTNGKIVLDYLMANKYVYVPFVITHPSTYRGPRCVDIHSSISGTKVIQELDANRYVNTVKRIEPDLIIVAGWSGMLSKELINVPKLGTVGFHPSKLPKDRGRSVLAWQIEEGYTETALTMFYYNELPDCGDIIAQELIKIEVNDYVSDIMDKVDDATYNIMRAYFPLIRNGEAPRKPQDLNDGSFRRLRTDRDSVINWDSNAEVIYNKIRAISRPYPGAHFFHKNKKIKVWKSAIINGIDELPADKMMPGHIARKLDEYSYVISCRDKFLKIQTDIGLEDL